jgi:putative peptidoglycan lipid II flippase
MDRNTHNGPEGRRLLSGLRILVSTTVLSRFLGMFRDMATAGLFGLGPVMDAFSFAFRIPNLARRLFGEGALTAAFLPAFARELEASPTGDRAAAWRLATGVLGLLAAALLLLVGIAEVALLLCRHVLQDHPEARLLLGLTAIMLPYAVLICLAAQVTAILQSLEEFAWPAAVPVVLNVFWIASVFVVDPWFEPDRVAQAYALAVCVVVAGALQLGLQLPPLLRLGFRWTWDWQKSRGTVLSIARGMVPVALGLSITQLTTVMDSAIAWFFSQPVSDPAARLPLPGAPTYPLSAGAVGALYLAERLYHFPLGVFGVALGTVLFPRLSRHAARADAVALRGDLGLGLRLVLTIGLPASAGLYLVASPLTRLIYVRGDFTVADALRTSSMVEAYAWGVWAYCAIPILQRGFFALGDRMSPLRIGLTALAVDGVLNLALIWPLAERGLAWSTAFSSTLQVVGLTWLLSRRTGGLPAREIAQTATRALVATAAMSLVVWALLRGVPMASATSVEAARLALLVGAGAGTFALVARGIGLAEVGWLTRGPRDEPDSDTTS